MTSRGPLSAALILKATGASPARQGAGSNRVPRAQSAQHSHELHLAVSGPIKWTPHIVTAAERALTY
jgi:hypothetical protein